MQMEPVFVSWMLNYLTAKPQYVRLQNCVSESVLCSTGAPQGTVLSPFLFTLYTSDFQLSSDFCFLQKFSDDSAVVGCIRGGCEGEYRSTINDFVNWSNLNHLRLNISKTKEMDFRRKRPKPDAVSVQGTEVELVSSYRYLGVQLGSMLNWSGHMEATYKKAVGTALKGEREIHRIGISAAGLKSCRLCMRWLCAVIALSLQLPPSLSLSLLMSVLIESAKESLQELGQKLSRKISRTEKFLRQHGEAEHRNQRFVEGAEQHLRVVGEQMEELLRQFLSALHACLLAHSRAGPGAGLQLRYNKIMEDWARLQQAQISLQSLLQENDPFQFVQEYLSTRKRLRKALRTQPFSPGSVHLDTEALAKVMEAKLQEFQTEFRLQITDLIRTVCAQNSGEEEEEAGEEEEEVVEEGEEEDDSESDEEEDGVHDVEANEGAEDDDQSGSAGDVYDPEEEEGEEEVSSD
ncbi:hypothetical protein GJAV_G00155890 [Gymnothorax javanicus]|nr:hypothetical protein GJAV_G00155890 [Gymnothorax javanicus]